MRTVKLYFDFISPYSYLVSQLVPRRPELEHVSLAFRPVAFGSILSKLALKGPGEIPVKRRAALVDVLLLAERYGLPLEGPPTHPFNPIYALRSVAALDDEVKRGALMRAYFRASWGEGKSLEDMDVLAACLAEVGVAQDPEEAATDGENRRRLKVYTGEAIDAGVFGVPTFEVDGLLFFGHDRLDLLTAYLAGDVGPIDPAKLEKMLGRPQPTRIV
ncbi:2-hydroxychromene-2-carboxylate isomerase [Myxococcota bacterium]|nr:2-hydroxychromene-2-carboxylate isomerase [Myxococcota bacterium]